MSTSIDDAIASFGLSGIGVVGRSDSSDNELLSVLRSSPSMAVYRCSAGSDNTAAV